MSFPIRRISLNFNAATGKLCDGDAAAALPSIFYHEELILCIGVKIYNDAGGVHPLPLPGDCSYAALASYGDDPRQPLIFRCANDDGNNAAINLPGDFTGGTTANPQQGQLSFRVNTKTKRFRDVVFAANKYQKLTDGVLCELALTATAPGGGKYVLGKCNFTAEKRPDDDGVIPETVLPEYLTGAEIYALFAAADSYAFSRDGQNWHSEQLDGDLFYRIRRTNAPWSVAMKFPFAPRTPHLSRFFQL